jgi:glycosyltransferase involved in cell wall biosynthesis
MKTPKTPPISLVLALRNERGGVEAIFRDVEELADYPIEMIFVEGGSTDGTYEEIARLAALPWRHKAVLLKQDGIGKKDAVVKGLRHATGELVFVYDADGEIAGSELPKFFDALAGDRDLFLNSTRFRLPMVKKMNLINRVGNVGFVFLMSTMVGSWLSDPLCGLKGTWREHYLRMIEDGVFDNDLDRFAEFDQLFGARRLGLKIRELPVVYRHRRYGESKVRRLKVGWQLLRRIAAEAGYRVSGRVSGKPAR